MYTIADISMSITSSNVFSICNKITRRIYKSLMH